MPRAVQYARTSRRAGRQTGKAGQPSIGPESGAQEDQSQEAGAGDVTCQDVWDAPLAQTLYPVFIHL